MLSKAQIKHIVSLHLPKFRKQHKQFIAEGPKLLSELLKSNFKIESICALDEWQGESRQLANRKGIPVLTTTDTELEKISALVTPNQVLAVVGIPPLTLDWGHIRKDITLMLDNIHDPGNMGTIIRISDWFGVAQIICSPDCVEAFNPKVVQASMGSIFRVKVIYQDLAPFLTDIREEEIPVFGAYLEGEDLSNATLPKNCIIIIGSESHGISAKLLPYVTNKIFIPAYSAPGAVTGGAESLNASVATGIILYEFRR